MEEPHQRADRKQERGIVLSRYADRKRERGKDRVDAGGPGKTGDNLSTGKLVEQLIPDECPQEIPGEMSEESQDVRTDELELDLAGREQGENQYPADVANGVGEAPSKP